MKNWFTILGWAIAIVLGLLYFKGCGDTKKLDADLQASHDSAQASEKRVTVIAQEKQQLSKLVDQKDSAYKKIIDSLTGEINHSNKNYEGAKMRIKNLVETLIEETKGKDTTHVLYNLDSLKIELSSASWAIDNLQGQYNERDSVCNAHTAFLDSSYKQLSVKFSNLLLEYQGAQVIIGQLQGDLGKAITSIKTRKKIGIARTIGEVLLAIKAFIIKK